MLDAETLRRRLLVALAMRGWEFQDLASRADISPTTFSGWWRGKQPELSTLQNVADALDVPRDYLVSESREVERKIKEALGMGRADVGEKEDAMPRKLTVEDVVAPKKSNYQRVEIPQMHKLPVVNKIAADEKPTFARAEGTEMVDVRYSRQNHYCLRVIGQSMKPTANEGDICVVEHVHHVLDALDVVGPADKKFWKTLHKKLVCASVNDADPVLKRMMVYDRPPRAKSNFKIILVGDNRSAESIEVTSEDRLVVVGIVRKIMKDPDNFE